MHETNLHKIQPVPKCEFVGVDALVDPINKET